MGATEVEPVAASGVSRDRRGGAPSVTAFTDLRFSRIWAETFGLSWEALDGRDDCGLVFAESGRLALCDYQLAPRGLYWGASGEGDHAQLVGQALRHCRRRRTAGLTWNFRHDAEQAKNAVLRELGERRCRVIESQTHVIPIDGRPYQEVLAETIKPVTRRKIRRAADAGLEIRPLATERELAAHFRLYRSWTERRNLPAHPPALFAGLTGGLTDSATLYGAFAGDTLLAAVLVFKDDREWLYWHGVRDPESDRRFAMYGLLAAALEQACAAGARFFNLGASDGLESLEFFKERWGAERRPVWCLRWTHPGWAPVISAWQWLRRAGGTGGN